MFKALSATAILLSAFVNGEDKEYSCRDQEMPIDLDYEIQSFEGQTRDSFYVHPFYSANAVIRILNFDQLRCGPSDIKIFNGPRNPGDTDRRSEIDWITIVDFDFDEIIFSIHPTLKQWKKLFRNQQQRLFTFSVIFAGETFDMPLVLKKPAGFVEFEYRPNNPYGMSEDQLDLNRASRPAVTLNDGNQWKQFTLHCPDQNCDQFVVYQKNGAIAQSTVGQTNINTKFGSIADIKARQGNNRDIYNKDGTIISSVYPFIITQNQDGNECIIKYVINEDAIIDGKNIEYFIMHPNETWRQYVDYTVAPLRWTKSDDDEFKNPVGIPQKYSHVDIQQQRIHLMPNYWHVIDMHVVGKSLKLRSKLEGLQYFRSTDPSVQRKYIIVDKNGKEDPNKFEDPEFDLSKHEQTGLHKGKIFGGLVCGGKKTETAISGKPSKNVINFSPEGDDGIKSKKQDGTIIERRQIKTHHGMFVFSLTFGPKNKETKELIKEKAITANSYIHYFVDYAPKPVYRTVKPLGSGKLSGSQLWPIRSNNAFVFGTNQEFKKKINENMNVVSFPMVQGMPNSIQIQCVDKCPLVANWLFNIKNVKDPTTPFSPFIDRKATAPSKWAAINEKYGFYVLNKLDYKEKRDGVNPIKQTMQIKTTTINSNPWSAFKRIKFQLYYHADMTANPSLEIDPINDILIMEFDANIIEWHGAGKFWAGLFALIAIIVAQIFSCWYMAKRNAAQKKSL